MEQNEKTMTGEKSLEIITEMITRTKSNFKQSSFHLLFWGWLILFCSLADYIIGNFTDYTHSYYIWFLTIPGALVSMIYGYKSGSKQGIFTYADRLNMWTWIAFMVAAVIMFILLSDRMGSVGPYILLLAGYPTFISGIIIKFRPLIIGGISFWVLALVAHFTGPAIAPLAVPLAVLTGYLIPGYLLRKEDRK